MADLAGRDLLHHGLDAAVERRIRHAGEQLRVERPVKLENGGSITPVRPNAGSWQ